METITICLSIAAGICGFLLLWLLIRSGYTTEVKTVLLYFVTQAEQMFGGKTGKLKKAAVLAWIYDKMPNIIRLFISSARLGELVDIAVEEMKKYLNENEAAAKIINSEK